MITTGSRVRVKLEAIKDRQAMHYQDKVGVVIVADIKYAHVKWEQAWTSVWKTEELEVLR